MCSALESFEVSQSHVDDDFTKWFSVIQNHLDRHAPLKTRWVKSKRMPEWFTLDIRDARKLRDHYKRSKNRSKFKENRSKMRNLICAAKIAHVFGIYTISKRHTKDMETFSITK